MAHHNDMLDRSFFARPPLDVAPELLGGIVVRGAVAVRLSEVEAYDGPNDPGSHAFSGMTPRNEVMFGPAGHLYVYFTYGMPCCCVQARSWLVWRWPERDGPRLVRTATLPAGQPGWLRPSA